MTTLYETDFAAWLEQQIELLKDKEFNHIDIEHIIEEMEGMSISDRRSLRNQFIRLIKHMLKLKYQPEKQTTSSSWMQSIWDSRREIEGILDDSPSLRPWLELNFVGFYLKAVREAAQETGISLELFETKCPWSLREVLGE